MYLIDFINILAEYKLPFDIIPGRVYKAPYVEIVTAKWFTNHKDEVITVWILDSEFETAQIIKTICLLHNIPTNIVKRTWREDNPKVAKSGTYTW